MSIYIPLIICYNCGDKLDFNHCNNIFQANREYQEYQKKGWKQVEEDGVWHSYCPNCVKENK